MAAFWELSTERQIGFAAGPIPNTAIESWIERHDLHEERNAFIQCIHEMDAAFLAHQNTPEEKRQKPVSKRALTPELFMAQFG